MMKATGQPPATKRVAQDYVHALKMVKSKGNDEVKTNNDEIDGEEE